MRGYARPHGPHLKGRPGPAAWQCHAVEGQVLRLARRHLDRGPWVGHPRVPGDQGLAEGAGFEPAMELPPYTLSRRAPSTTRPPLRNAPQRGLRRDSNRAPQRVQRGPDRSLAGREQRFGTPSVFGYFPNLRPAVVVRSTAT